jgi:hypothetical protein
MPKREYCTVLKERLECGTPTNEVMQFSAPVGAE